MFVAIEGIECSGKSTLIERLRRLLEERGRRVVVTREPGGTPLGDAIRGLFLDPLGAMQPLTETLLINAARVEHVRAVIAPASSRGAIVLCDRFIDSTLAYQGYGRGLDLDDLRRSCERAADGVLPDLTLVLDLEVAQSRARMRARGDRNDRLEREDDAFHERVRAGFLALAREPRHALLDANLPADELSRAAFAMLEAMARV